MRLNLPLRTPESILPGSWLWIFFYNPALITFLLGSSKEGVSGIWIFERRQKPICGGEIILKKREDKVLLIQEKAVGYVANLME